MYRLFTPFMLVLALAAGPVFAEETTAAVPMQAPVQATAPAAKKSSADEVVCKSSTSTGTLIPGAKTCMTRAQWEHQASDASKSVSDLQNGSLHNGTAGR